MGELLALAALVCGLGVVTRSAVEVRRRGGERAATGAVWHEVITDRVRGWACPDCHPHVQAEGVGPTAVALALVAYVARTDPPKAGRLRRMLAEEGAPEIPMWEALSDALRPSQMPFAHLRRIINRI